MVVFAGEPPINAKFYNQNIDQAPLVTATGAHYIAAHSVPRMMNYVRRPLHRQDDGGRRYCSRLAEGRVHGQPAYETRRCTSPRPGACTRSEVVAEAVERLAAAKRPIILGGRGVLWSAHATLRSGSPRCGALTPTLPARAVP
jgi:hypothetical protein